MGAALRPLLMLAASALVGFLLALGLLLLLLLEEAGIPQLSGLAKAGYVVAVIVFAAPLALAALLRSKRPLSLLIPAAVTAAFVAHLAAVASFLAAALLETGLPPRLLPLALLLAVSGLTLAVSYAAILHPLLYRG